MKKDEILPSALIFKNPFRPGAGHMPPYLAGRQDEENEFRTQLEQDPILKNIILTGLRGVGKTVLMETFRPIALESGWTWVSNDLSETASISEENLAVRILTDLAVFTSTLSIPIENAPMGLRDSGKTETAVNYALLYDIFCNAPGLISDKLKAVFEYVWTILPNHKTKGIVFAYDEAQNLQDAASKSEYPLSMLLEVFQSIQRKGVRFMLVLTGLPTIFPKLVAARTYSERMFHQIFLQALDEESSKQAILKPIEDTRCPIRFNDESVNAIVQVTAGYPYFIQYICKEVYDIWIQKFSTGDKETAVPIDELVRKLDSDFFSGRWARVTDRQRDLLRIIASLTNCDTEFTNQDIVEYSEQVYGKPLGGSHVHQMLAALMDAGIVYKNRHGKYSFAVPLMGQFILRQTAV